ncbi:MAG: glycosyltransferase [bacterium]|nr:glycosyltransferase [bacterium]
MRVYVSDKHTAAHEKALMAALAAACKTAGHEVVNGHGKGWDVAFSWNGRDWAYGGPVVFCELGWLPRWSYQLSWDGINAASHLAPFEWDGKPLTKARARAVAKHITAITQGPPADACLDGYADTTAAATDVGYEFILCPLQVETDTNMAHVPEEYRTAQGFVDAVEAQNLPYPVLFKAHPASDANNDVAVSEPNELIAHDRKRNLYSYLRDPSCRGVVTLNSNTAHDALLFDVPALVLGKNVWPEETGPFFVGWPARWASFSKWSRSKARADAVAAYSEWLMQNQWTLAQAGDPERVGALLTAALEARAPADVPREPVTVEADGPQLVVNVVARNMGWLFEDIKGALTRTEVPGAIVVGSERARSDADAWYYLRPDEAPNSVGELSRSVLSVHDLVPRHMETIAPALSEAGGVSLVNPDQLEALERLRVDWSDTRLLMLPIGCGREFSPDAGGHRKRSGRFAVGWFGRGLKQKRPEMFTRALAKLQGQVRCAASLVGDQLEACERELSHTYRVPVEYLRKDRLTYAKYPDVYRRLDAVVITSELEAGPLCLYEALASGVPVVTTDCSAMVRRLIHEGVNGYIRSDAASIAVALRSIADNRREWHGRRHAIAGTLEGLSYERWLEAQIRLCMEVAAKS